MARKTPERMQLPLDKRDVLSADEKQRSVKVLARQIYTGATGKAHVLEAGSLGGKDSAHDVFFAAADGHPTGVVAVKRFRRTDDATRELEAIRIAKERGFTTLKPVGDGVYHLGENAQGEDLGTALVTARLPHFKTMNQVGWQNYYAGEPEYENVASTLRSIARFTGHTNRQGMVIGDRQLKNYAQIPPNKFVLFDLEGADIYEPGSNDTNFHDGCSEDVGDLVKSLVVHGFLSGATNNVFVEEVTANVLAPYMEVNMSEQVLDSWDGIMNEALLLRAHGNREMVGSALGHLVAAGAATVGHD